jgi:hypothetical protein
MKPKFIELETAGFPIIVNAEHICCMWELESGNVCIVQMKNNETLRVIETMKEILKKIGG